MKKIYTRFLSAAVVLSTLLSCNLELSPTDAVVYDEGSQIIFTRTDLASFEAGVMSDYRALHGGMYDAIEDLMLDEFNATVNFGNNYGGVHRTDDSFTSSDSYIESYWVNHYLVMKDYNVLIDALVGDPESEEPNPNIPAGTEQLANVVLGECYFVRAEAYLNLVRRFAKDYDPSDTESLGVPLVLHYSLTDLPKRSTVHEVYAQIKNDLDSAAVHLAGVAGEVGAQYPTIDAVNALYARYYLDIEDFDNAIAKAQEVIGTGKYALSKSATEMEAEFSNDAGTEAIMQMFGSLDETPNSLGVYTSMVESPEYGTCFRSMFLPTKKLVDAYGASDLRRSWFSTTDYYTDVNGTYYRGNFATFVKFIGNKTFYTSDTPNAMNMAKPYKIGEMYLIKAEAQSRNGDIPGAKATLKILQDARKGTVTSGSMASVRDEWFRETPGEGFRLSCLKRWGEGFEAREGQTGALNVNALMTGASYTEKSMAADDYHLVWPIPAGEIRLNPNLEQNPVYGRQ